MEPSRMDQFRQGLNEWLPIIAGIILLLLLTVLVIFLFTKAGGDTPVWFQAVVVVTIVLLALVAISLLSPSHAAQGVVDAVPIRLGVILLGIIVVACIAGLIQVINNPPQVVEGQVIETTTPPEPVEGAVQSEGGSSTDGGGETTPPSPSIETTTVPSTGTVANTANLGLSGQIVGIFGTIAAAAVGGIAGLLTQRQ